MSLRHWIVWACFALGFAKVGAADAEPPPPELAALEWIPLFSAGDLPSMPDAGEEYWANARLLNVQQPSLGVMRTDVGDFPRPAFIICAGGGYNHLAILQEAYPLGKWLNAHGIDAYLLKYRLKEWGYPAPLQDVTQAVRMLRANVDSWQIDPARIGVVGFSAGGHVAGMSATLWGLPEAVLSAESEYSNTSARPDLVAMIYPVVTMQEPFTHQGSRHNLLGPAPTELAIKALSLEERVRPDSPPVFLVHTDTDTAVPAENSLQFATALRAQKVPVELHLFAEGPHGFGLRLGHGAASDWPDQFCHWLKSMGWLEEAK
jgi:acetyl esterase/lipase